MITDTHQLSPPSFRRKSDPGRRMVAGLVPAADRNIDITALQAPRRRRVEQQVVHPQSRAFVVSTSKGEIPVGKDALLRMERSQSVGPAGLQHHLVSGAALREADGIINPPLR